MQIINKYFVYALSASIFIASWAWIPFGIDHFDQGYVLAAAKLFFAHPEDVVPDKTGGYWLTLLPIASLLAVGGDYGASLVRTAVIPVALLISAAACFLVRQRMDLRIILIVGAVTHLISRSWRVDGFLSYPVLSTFAFVAAVFMFVVGGARNSKWLMLFGGAALGASIFIRLPNVAGLVLLGLPLLFYALNDWQFRLGLQQTAWAIVGAVLGCCLTLSCMFALGHIHLFFTGLEVLRSIASSDDSPYSTLPLIINISTEVVLSWFFAFELVLVGACAALFSLVLHPKLRFIAGLLVGSYVGIFVLADDTAYRIAPYGTVFLILCANILRPRRNPQERTIDVGALVVFMLVPLGAATGISTGAATAALFAAPVAIVGFLEMLKGAHRWIPTDSSRFAIFGSAWPLFIQTACIVALSLTAISVIRLPYTARDFSGYGAPTDQFESVNLPGVFLDPGRADRFDEVISELSKYTEPGDFLLAFGNIPLIYFLTDLRPYLVDSWPLRRSHSYVCGQLKWSLENRDLPVVLRTAPKSLHWNWPGRQGRVRVFWFPLTPNFILDLHRTLVVQQRTISARIRNFLAPTLRGPNTTKMVEDNTTALNSFVGPETQVPSGRYRSVWSNEAFEILIPNQSATAIQPVVIETC